MDLFGKGFDGFEYFSDLKCILAYVIFSKQIELSVKQDINYVEKSGHEGLSFYKTHFI